MIEDPIRAKRPEPPPDSDGGGPDVKSEPIPDIGDNDPDGEPQAGNPSADAVTEP